MCKTDSVVVILDIKVYADYPWVENDDDFPRVKNVLESGHRGNKNRAQILEKRIRNVWTKLFSDAVQLTCACIRNNEQRVHVQPGSCNCMCPQYTTMSIGDHSQLTETSLPQICPAFIREF